MFANDDWIKFGFYRLQFFEFVLESDQNMSDGFKWFKVTRDGEPKDNINDTVGGS